MGLPYNVVKKLLDVGQYLRKGYHIFVDNFFTSIPLANYLYDNLTYITGTLRRNCKGIPHEMKNKFAVGQKLYMRNDNLLMLGYREKKSQKNPVLLLSTKHTATDVESKKKRNQNNPNMKPKVIDDYNRYMGGIYGRFGPNALLLSR